MLPRETSSSPLIPELATAFAVADTKGLDEAPRRTYRKQVSNGPIAQLVELRTFNP